MNRIILNLEIGNWDGGNNGYYPKLVEWDMQNPNRPVLESEGWGHGLGGGNFSIKEFSQRDTFSEMESGSSNWAFQILSLALQSAIPDQEINAILLAEASNHKYHIADNLRAVLCRNKRYINA